MFRMTRLLAAPRIGRRLGCPTQQRSISGPDSAKESDISAQISGLRQMLYDMDIAQRDRLQDGLRYQTSELRGEISTARETLEKQLLSVETNLANQIAILGSESWARDDHLRDDVRTLGRTSKNYLMQAFIYAAGGLSLLGASVLFLPLKGYLEAGAAATQPPKTLNASILPTPATTQPLAKEN